MNNQYQPLWTRTNYRWFTLFVIIFVIEFLLFRNYVLREVVQYYPNNFDQTAYLVASYTFYENILHNGLLNAIHHMNFEPTSIIFPLQAALFFLFFGASRFSALLINFFYYVMLQIFALYAVKSITGTYLIAAIFLGLILCLLSPFFWAGGMMDFRIDFMAMCLYGIFVSCIMRSKIFLETKWTVIAMAFAIILILLRCITAVYLSAILGLLFSYFLLLWVINRNNLKISFIKQRLKNLSLSAIVLSITVLPFLWLNRNAIYNYYVVGHVTGSEKYIRAKEQGTTNLKSALEFYPKSIFTNHIGSWLIWFCFLMVVAIFGLFLLRAKKKFIINSDYSNNLEIKSYFHYGLVFLILCIFMPVLALTLDTSKSPVVGGIVSIPLLWFFLWIFISLFFELKKQNVRIVSYLAIAISVIAILAGGYNYILNTTKHNDLYYRDHMNNITKMYLDIGKYIYQTGWKNSTLSIDQITDYLTPGGITGIYYEKTGRLLNIGIKLGGSQFINKTEALADLKDSSIFITNLHPYQTTSPFPYDSSMKTLQPILRQVADKTMVKLNDYQFDNSTFRVYVKPDVIINGDSHGLVTSDGITIEIPELLAKKISKIILTGNSNFHRLSAKPIPSGIIVLNNNREVPVGVDIEVNQQQYLINVRIPKRLSMLGVRKIKLPFSNYFIPKQIGIDDDGRKLVIKGPVVQKIVLSNGLSTSI